MPEHFNIPKLKKATNLNNLRVYSKLGSTNALAQKLIEAGEINPPGAIIAELQTSGQGQATNSWYADEGSLATTFILPAAPLIAQSLPLSTLPLRAGLAVRKTLDAYINNQEAKVKWPNDVLIMDKKIAGILCKQIRDTLIIGIGINVTTNIANGAKQNWQQRATSLAGLTDAPPPRDEVFISLYRNLQSSLTNQNWLDEYKKYDALTDKKITIDTGTAPITGQYLGIDGQGKLLIDDGKGKRAIMNGSIKYF